MNTRNVRRNVDPNVPEEKSRLDSEHGFHGYCSYFLIFLQPLITGPRFKDE